MSTLALRLSLTRQLVRREIAARYRGSALGVLWSLLTPLMMLGIYTFVFGTVFKARWATPADSALAEPSSFNFSIILFTGLILFQLFSDVITRAPTLVLSQANYVKKVVFPLEILVPVALGAALFHTGVSLLVLLALMLSVQGSIPITALLLPLVVAPFGLLILGLGWFLASLGVYVRDLGQFLGTLVTALMFLSPIFFPASALPEYLRPWLAFNPISLPVEEARNVLIFGKLPDFLALGVYALAALAIAVLGYSWFKKTRRGFADVL